MGTLICELSAANHPRSRTKPRSSADRRSRRRDLRGGLLLRSGDGLGRRRPAPAHSQESYVRFSQSILRDGLEYGDALTNHYIDFRIDGRVFDRLPANPDAQYRRHHPSGGTRGHTHRDAHAYTRHRRHSIGQDGGHDDCLSCCHRDIDPNPNPRTHSNPNTDANSYTHANTDSGPYTHSHSYANSHAAAHSDTSANTHPHPSAVTVQS